MHRTWNKVWINKGDQEIVPKLEFERLRPSTDKNQNSHARRTIAPAMPMRYDKAGTTDIAPEKREGIHDQMIGRDRICVNSPEEALLLPAVVPAPFAVLVGEMDALAPTPTRTGALVPSCNDNTVCLCLLKDVR